MHSQELERRAAQEDDWRTMRSLEYGSVHFIFGSVRDSMACDTSHGQSTYNLRILRFSFDFSAFFLNSLEYFSFSYKSMGKFGLV